MRDIILVYGMRIMDKIDPTEEGNSSADDYGRKSDKFVPPPDHYINGKLNDGPNGEPAVQRFHQGGALKWTARYRNGQLNDGINGEPAIERFNESGVRISSARYTDGKLDNGNYKAAIFRYDESGALTNAEHYRAGVKTYAYFYKDGQWNDGPNGEPAMQRFNKEGGLAGTTRYRDGSRNDGPNGEPAEQQFDKNGALQRVYRYTNDISNDGPNGEPAAQHFNGNDVLIEALHYKNGKKNDGPNGEPAIQHFSDTGVLTRAERFKDGIPIQVMTASEIRSYVAETSGKDTSHDGVKKVSADLKQGLKEAPQSLLKPARP